MWTPKMLPARRPLLALCAGLLLLGGGLYALRAQAQTAPWPGKPVRIVVNNAPGGGTDIAARILATKLTQMWGQSVYVDNKAGASGAIGADLVAKAAPDGYTLLLSPQTATAIASVLNPGLSYDVLKDFTSISVVCSVPTLLVATPGLPVRTFQEFSAYAKARPTELSFGSGGEGSTQHLAGEMLNVALGVKMQHIPYKGENPAIVDLVGGQLPVMFATLSTALPHIASGKVRGIALASLKRSTAAPDLPTIAESGLPGFEMAPWYGLFGPAGLPREQSARISADVARVLAQADVREQFAKLGFDLVGNTPDEAATYMRSEIAKYQGLVKAAHISIPK